MKEIDRHDIEIPEDFKEVAVGVSLEFRRYEMQTGSDRIEIHIFQPDGAETHRKSTFKLIDEEEGTVAFLKSNHNEPEPYQMALFGLGLEGFQTKRNWELEQSEEYENRAQTFNSMALSVLTDADEMHEFDAKIARDVASHLFILGALYDFNSNEEMAMGEVFDQHGAEAIEMIQLAGANEVKEITQKTFYKYVAEYLNDKGMLDDE